jgi:arginase
MLKAGLLDQLQNLGWVVHCAEKLQNYEQFRSDENDDSHPIVRNVKYVSKVTQAVREKIKTVCKKGHLALTLGGDHSIGMATVSGACSVYPNLGVIWVDAHADINTVESTDSGNLHGMPVSFLLGLGSKVKEFEWLKPCLKVNKIVYIGLRDVDAGMLF